jgi:eukaryotic-like serine/threonine-protein kinase
MGEVCLARDTRLDRQVMIKALPAHLATDPDRRTHFQREAKVLASLNHPGIRAMYGLKEAAGLSYLHPGIRRRRDVGRSVDAVRFPLTKRF